MCGVEAGDHVEKGEFVVSMKHRGEVKLFIIWLKLLVAKVKMSVKVVIANM